MQSDDSVEFDQDVVVVESMEGLAKQVAELAKEKVEMKQLMEGLAKKVAQMGEEQAQEKAKSAEELAKCQDQLKDVKNALEKLVEEKAKQQGQMEQLKKRVKELEKQQKLLEEEQRMASAEYASLIEVPVVANLKAHYDRKKFLKLLQHGNIRSIYIQDNQYLNDPGLLQSIVDLLATAEKPEKMVKEVKIELGPANFAWLKRGELKLKERKANVICTFNEASASPTTSSDYCLEEYLLTNRGCRFQVLLYYYEMNINDAAFKFIYRRLG